MAIIEIKHWNGDVLHTIEADSIKAAVEALVGAEANLQGANLREADLREANLRGADLRGADLQGANLGGANLREANLGGADLWGADLREADLQGADLQGANLGGANLREANLGGANLWGANLREANLGGAEYGTGIPLTKIPISISGLNWDVMILDSHLKIGCELHTFGEWENFTNKEISNMDSQALAWWKIHKAPIMALIKAVRP